MKKLTILMVMFLMLLVGCSKTKTVSEGFMEGLTKATSYEVEGVMETFFDSGRKQSNFTVYYKAPDYYKVVIKSFDNADQQIILKNKDGVYVLMPSVNKNFKINSTWPDNSSYPYLLQSLATDIANDADAIITEDEDTYTIETKATMHTNATVAKQKIIFNKATSLPTEVLVYDDNNNLYVRCVFTNIEWNKDLTDDEFDVSHTLSTARSVYGEEGLVFSERYLELPSYYPLGSDLNSKSVNDVRAIMKFTGDVNFTIIQELVDDCDTVVTREEDGEVLMLLDSVAIVTETYLKFIYEGIQYTIASEDLNLPEMLKVAYSYMKTETTVDK